MSTDKKISQLSSGAPAQAGDEYVVARSGANYKLTLTNIAASMPATTITSGNLIVSSGDVGIGAAVPGAKLQVQSGTSPTQPTWAATDVVIAGNSAGNAAYYQSFSDSAGGLIFSTPTTRAKSFLLWNDVGGNSTWQNGSTGALVLSTNGSERMRIDSSGNVGIGGTADAFAKFQIRGTLPTSSTITVADYSSGTVPSGTTSSAFGYYSALGTQAASFTLTSLIHNYVNPAAFGAGSTVSNQYGYYAESTLTGATSNFGFFSNIASGSNRWNFYAAGTAQNYFAGNTLIGTTADLGSGARVNIESASGEADVLAMRYNNAAAGKHWRFQIDSNSRIYLVNQAGTGVYINDGDTSWTGTSDEKIKTALTPIENAASKVSTLRAVTGRYTWDSESVSRSFLIAQDVQKVLPEAVDIPENKSDPLGLRYTDVVPLLVAAIKELTARVAELEAK
jgi:hypothetical protein